MTTTTLSSIHVDRVSRSFGRSYAVNRVTTRFDAGRIVALLGPNGAGKSTLITLLATLQRPDSGTIRFMQDAGTDALSFDQVVRRHRSLIGYVSHDALLYADLTGAENLRFYAQLYGLATVTPRVEALLERVGMTDAAHRLVRTYSRGMRQRLSVARALLQSPAVLLLDEPLTGIDHEGAKQLLGMLAEEKAAQRIIVVSTHRLSLDASLIDEVRVMQRGRLRLTRALEPGERLADAYAAALQERD